MHLRESSNIAAILGRSAAVVICVLLLATLSMGQVTSGTISGLVKDPSGAVVAGATVTATEADKGIIRTGETSGSGEFVFPNLPPGNYTISVDAKGFKKLEKSDVILNVADHVNAGELTLQMGTTTESLTVTADAGQIQLQSNSGERSDLISNKQLEDVAMNGRNVLDYMKLVPGVISSFDGHASGTGGLDAMNINGTRANQHEFTVDGASNVDTGNNGGTHVTINPDAIEEVKILTSNYQAEYGKAAGGQIAIVTKSGTNQWHGGASFFHRNEGMNANDALNKAAQVSAPDPSNQPALYRYNYIGYNLGGPILKNKLFVFWDQEYYEQLIPIGGTTQFYTPTALERQGDFSQSTDGNGNPVKISGPGIVNNKIDPSQLPSAQQATFANVQKILNLFPLPNVSGFGVGGQNFNFSQALSGKDPRREDILRIDYQIDQNDRVFVRWINNVDHNTSPFLPFPGPFGIFACSSSINFPGGCTQNHPGWNLSVNLVSTFKPTVINELSVGPSHTESIAEGVNGNISLAKNGINLPLLYPTDTIPDLGFSGLNNVNFGGGYLGATPWSQYNTTLNINDSLTWVKGVHTMKFGIFYQKSNKNQISWGNINGQVNFNQGPSAPASCPDPPNPDGSCPDALGDPLASALLGSYSSLGQSTARPTGYFRYNQIEFYGQDTWKVTPRLTLDYGLRFAYIPPQFDAKNQVALFNPAAYDPNTAVQIDGGGNIIANSGNPLDGMQYTANGQLPPGGWKSRGLMAEPRFGFAYSLFNNNKTVLRGGFGMMHDRVQGNLIFNTVFNNPAIVQTAQLPAGNLADLATATPSFGNPIQADKNIVGAAPDGHVPTVYSYSLGIQHEIMRDTTLDVAYVGNFSRHLVTSHDINAIPYGYAFTAAAQDPANFTSYCAAPAPGNPCTNGVPQVEPGLPAIYSNQGFGFSGAYAYGRSSYSNAPLVPYKGYGQIAYLGWDGNANYNSLQISLQRRFSKGLTFGVVYTWSKALLTANADQDYQDPFQPKLLDYRTADWDRTHVFAANFVYDLPNTSKHMGGSKWVSYLVDHYQLSGVVQAMTGTPADLNNNYSFESGAVDGSNMWGAIPYYYTLDKSGNPVLPPIADYRLRGTRDVLRNGGMQNWDLSLFKNIPVRERYSLQLRLEAYNAFNHPNFDTKNYNINVAIPQQWDYPGQAGAGPGTTSYSISKSNNWGTPASTYTAMGGARVLQIGAKFTF
jgi:hypothetical protein